VRCRRIVSARDVDDAVQETFIAVYRSVVRGRRPQHPRAWLHTIARNACFEILRRADPEQPILTDAERESPDCAAEVEAQLALDDVLEHVRALPGDQRAALTLLVMADLSQREIAEVLGCRQARVKALVFEARSALRRGRRPGAAVAMD
jgi:RNA polymerase sigma-70 factor (ECF subfamily)